MIRTIAIATFVLAAQLAAAEAADEIDARIARLEKENAKLKKTLRLQELERENARLQTLVQSKVYTRAPVGPAAPDTAAATASKAPLLAFHPERPAYQPFAEPEFKRERWNGAYAGGYVGGGFGNWSLAEQYQITGGFGSDTSNNQVLRPLGFLAGAQAGYLWQLGHLSFGPEVEIGVANIKQAKTVLYINRAFASAWYDTASASLDWFSTVRGRVGVSYGDWLVYGAAGLAIAGVTAQGPAKSSSASSVAVGYSYGGGISHAVSDRLALRLEYQRVQLPDQQLYSDAWTIFGQTVTSALTLNPSVHIVKGGIDWSL